MLYFLKLKDFKDLALYLSLSNTKILQIDEIKLELTHIDIDNLTPIEALMKLHEIKRKIGLDK